MLFKFNFFDWRFDLERDLVMRTCHDRSNQSALLRDSKGDLQNGITLHQVDLARTALSFNLLLAASPA